MAASIVNNQMGNVERTNKKTATTTQKTIVAINVVLIVLSVIFSIGIFYLSSYKINKTTSESKTNISAISELYNCDSRKLIMQITHYSDFWWMKNVYIGERARVADCGHYVTYVTHSKDLSVFDELGTLAESWGAPISLIIFAPGERFQWTMKAIQYSRNCLPQSNFIREFVSFHIFLPHGETPDAVPHNEEEALAWPYECKKNPPQANKLAIEAFSQNDNNRDSYPVNVARNLARRAVNSHFVLLSDFTNIPNAGTDISKDFLNMLLKKYCVKMQNSLKCTLGKNYEREVYKLRTYKLKPGTKLPNDLNQLNELKVQQNAQTELLALPVFIGHRYMPYYDERFYEPQADVHSYLQLYAMCLQGYVSNTLPDPHFLTYFERNNTDLSTSAYIRNLTDLTMHNLNEEYLPLFGYNSEERCQTCIAKGMNCLASTT